jgi:WD40 repeat protein
MCHGIAPLRRVLLAILVMVAAQENVAAQGIIAIESDHPLAVAYSPRATVVAATGFGGGVKLWEARTGALLRTIPGPNKKTCRALAFSPDGKLLAVGCEDGLVYLWNVGTGDSKAVFAGHIGGVTAVAFAADGATLASAARNHEIKDNRATGRTDGEIRLWDVPEGRAKQVWKLDQGDAPSLAFSPDGKMLASAEGPVRLREVQTGKVTRTLTPERGLVRAIAFSPDGQELAGGGGYPVAQAGGGVIVHSEVRIWKVASGEVRLTLTDFHPWLSCLAISPDGQALATGGDGPWRQGRGGAWRSGDVRLWNLKTGTLLRTIEQKRPTAFSPDGGELLTGDAAEVALTETATGVRRATLMTVTQRPVGK